MAGAASQLTPPVIAAIFVAAAITIGSWYYSSIYQPRKMQRAYKKALYTLAAAVETKDSGTIGHAERVAGWAVAVAEALGIPRAERLRIEYAALLRDIGKVKVPASLLNKTTHLSDEEWDEVKSHSRLGAEIASSVPFLSSMSDLILHHHECWDGSGYPGGLAGEEIPLGARILAVATDYDASISERPYHKPQSPEVSLEQIRSGRGTRYDPAVVDAFVEIIQIKDDR